MFGQRPVEGRGSFCPWRLQNTAKALFAWLPLKHRRWGQGAVGGSSKGLLWQSPNGYRNHRRPPVISGRSLKFTGKVILSQMWNWVKKYGISQEHPLFVCVLNQHCHMKWGKHHVSFWRIFQGAKELLALRPTDCATAGRFPQQGALSWRLVKRGWGRAGGSRCVTFNSSVRGNCLQECRRN